MNRFKEIKERLKQVKNKVIDSFLVNKIESYKRLFSVNGSKEDADIVLDKAKLIAKKMVVVFGPIGSVRDSEGDKGPHKHRHEWTCVDLSDLGFDVTKLEDYHGPGEHAMIGVWHGDA